MIELLLLLGASAILSILLVIVVGFITILFNKPNFLDNKKNAIIVILICFILSISYLTMKEYWGTDTIGSFFSQSKYTTKYLVSMRQNSNNNLKEYRVPAEILVSGNRAALYRVFWPNGGYTTFNNYGDDLAYEFYKYKIIDITDDTDREWTIVLTTEKVK